MAKNHLLLVPFLLLFFAALASALPDICSNFNNSLLASYHLQNNGNDSSGNGFTAALGNVTPETKPIFVSSCQVGGCYNFSRENQSFLNVSNINFSSGSFTVSMWINTSASPFTSNGLFLKGDESGNFGQEGFRFAFESGGFGGDNIRFEFITDSGDGTVYPSLFLPRNVWQMVTVTLNATDARVYVNGSLLGLEPVIGTYSDFNLPVIIGRGDMSSTLNGSIDEIHIWNRALNASEIASLYSEEFSANSLPDSCITPPAAGGYTPKYTGAELGSISIDFVGGFINGLVTFASSLAGILIFSAIIGALLIAINQLFGEK